MRPHRARLTFWSFWLLPLAGATTPDWKELRESGNELRAQGRLEEAERLLVQALDEVGKAGNETTDVAVVLDDLAFVEIDRSRFRSAEDHAIRSLMIRQRSLGVGHPRVGDSLD